MITRIFKHYYLFSITMGMGLAFGVQAAKAPDIGSLPTIKINKKKAELGKRLFFDPRLSGDAAISCASCHKPQKGFADGLALSKGYPGNKHFRNTPTLINVAHKKVWMHDGRIGTNLNDTTCEMLTEDYIMNMDMRIMQERLKQDPLYIKMFKDAGYGEPSNGGVRKAIPEFLKTLTSRGAAFDTGRMSASAKRGMKLFQGKGNCVQCHNGSNFTDNKAYNTGVAENFDVFLDPVRHQAFLAYAMFVGVGNYMNLKRDPGAHIQEHKADGSSMGKFQTPSLRELKYTAPYMHNGAFYELSEVVDFYNRGGVDEEGRSTGYPQNKSKLIKPLGLTDEEKEDLVAFIESFSGDEIEMAKPILPSYAPLFTKAELMRVKK